MGKLKFAITRCTNPNCRYKAMTWHKDLDDLNPCLKCGGKLEGLLAETEVKTK